MKFYKYSIILKFLLILSPFHFTIAKEIHFTEPEQEWLNSNRTNIRVGIHEYPPLVIRKPTNENEFDGISIQYLHILEKKIGVNFEFVSFDSWSELLEQVKANKVDIIFAIQQTPERDLFLLFTDPYLSSNNQIIVRKDTNFPHKLSLNSNYKVAAIENSALYSYLRNTYPNIRLIPVKDELNALAKVSTGEVDLSIGEISRISYYFHKELFSNLTISGTVDFKYDFRFGVRKDLLHLQNILQKALDDFSNQERDLILKNWIYIDQKKFYQDSSFWIWTGSFLSVFIIIVISFWNRTLNRLVDHKTQLLKESEESHRLAKEQAEAGNRAKSEFLASMSHEIRTPLNAVIGFTDLLMKTKLNNTQAQYMELVYQSANSLLDLLNDILDFSKIEAGKFELNIDRMDIFELVAQAADVIKYKAKEKKIEVILNIPTKTPRFIYSDPVRLRQILINLLGNAVKFTNQGEIEIKIDTFKSQESESELTYIFSVRDTGIGISKENQSKIFEAFSQADSSTTRKYGGSGLGLTISNKLLELMNSKLQLESELEKGSKFFFELSLAFEDGHISDYNGLKYIKNVLVVDDNQTNRIILKEMLFLKSINSDLAYNGLEALKKIKENNYDVIIMDYQMPEMDGMDVIRQIRNYYNLENKEQPIILLHSSSDTERLHKECNELKINLKILKPIKIDELFSALNKVKIHSGNINEENNSNLPDRTKNDSILTNPNIQSQKIKILLVDDDEINMYLAKSILSQIYQNGIILEANNGKEAVEIFKTENPDIIFMDIQMPEMNGYEATMEIRKLETALRTPIIALTAGTVKGDSELCFNAGMDDYATKPIKKDMFDKILDKWLPTA